MYICHGLVHKKSLTINVITRMNFLLLLIIINDKTCVHCAKNDTLTFSETILRTVSFKQYLLDMLYYVETYV